ncbi:MAG: 4a-hydroxytetrahydrobiopterin dehydratase [Solirubrobacteraceae bacterium]|nr:4a-hydroxytetrahydrobiopterin dehydratase [Patulibacter sp.]
MASGDVARELADLPRWLLAADGRSIVRELHFASFSAAFGFMTAVAIDAEAMDHHPDWSNSYKTVSVALSTHVAGGLTQRDFALARQIDAHAVAALPD